jgi:hypothetical protein
MSQGMGFEMLRLSIPDKDALPAYQFLHSR